MSARQTQNLSIPTVEQLSRWIVLTLKWLVIGRWLQINVNGVEKLEEFGRTCINYNEWREKIQSDLILKPDSFPEIFDEGVYHFFRHEGNEIKEKEKRLSSAAGKGL